MENYNQIFDLIITETDRRNFLSFLSDIKQSIFKTDNSLKEILVSNATFGKALNSFVPENLESMEVKNELVDKLEEIEKMVKSLKSIDITLAVSANDNILKALTLWANDNFDKKVIFNIVLDPHIIGGAIIVIDGKYMDYSLLKKLNDAFNIKRDQIMSVINTPWGNLPN